MSTELEFSGRNVHEAVEKACFALQVEEKELEYEIVCRESRKLFGLLGSRDARIRVVNRETSSRELVQDLIKSAFGKEYQPSVEGKEGDGKKTVRKTRSTGPAVSPEPADVKMTVSPSPLSTPSSAVAAKKGKSVSSDFAGSAVTYETEKIIQTASRILELMGFAGIKVETELRENGLGLDICGDELQPLLARRGAVLDAIQFLLNKIHGVKGGRITVDCNNFRSRHKEDISELALRLGAKAKRLRKPVTINALNAHDRRLVHLALQDDQELRSRSKGEGEFKKIVIYPANSQPRRRSRSRSSSAETH